MTDMQKITDQLFDEARRAIRTLDENNAKAIDQVKDALKSAEQARREGMTDVRRKRQEAAEIIAATLREEEQIEAEYIAALVFIHGGLSEIRPKRVAAPVKMKAIAGGKAAE